MEKGQINRGSTLGEWIYNLCKKDDVNVIVDIGTWNGLGTTKCIHDALIDSEKKGFTVLSLETNPEMHAKANMNLPATENFRLVLGRIIESEELIPVDSLGDSYFSEKKTRKEDMEKWFKEDIENYRFVPNVLQEIPEKIDLCIFDGGEFSSYAEFQKLESRCRYVILDDVNMMKNLKVAEYIRNNPEYTVLEDNPDERTGYLIAERKG